MASRPLLPAERGWPRQPLRRSPPAKSPAISVARHDDEARLGEDAEQDRKKDRDLPQAPLDPAPASIHGRVATKGGRQARASRLHEYGDHQEDADDVLANGQGGIHSSKQPRIGSAESGPAHVSTRPRPAGWWAERATEPRDWWGLQLGLSQKRVPGDVRPGLQTADLQDRRRDVGEAAVLEPLAVQIAADAEQRHRIERGLGDGGGGLVLHFVGVA